jgi:ferritin
MLPGELVAAIEAEIGLELYSASLYRQLAGWAHVNGLSRLEKHFADKVPEETAHADKFRAFLESNRVLPRLVAVDAIPDMHGELLDVMQTALAHEERVTAAIDAMCAMAMQRCCGAACALLLGFAAEQAEEVDEASRLLRLAEQSGTPAEFDSSIV